MKIGHIRKEKSKDGKTWLVMDLAMPLAGRTRVTISPNDKKQPGSMQPDYYLWYNMNARGQNHYKSARVGALWNKRSKDGSVEYKDGYIEHPFAQNGKINIAVFQAKQEGETPPAYTHEVTWNPPRHENTAYDTAYAEPAYTQSEPATQTQPDPHPKELPEIDIDEDDIPF